MKSDAIINESRQFCSLFHSSLIANKALLIALFNGGVFINGVTAVPGWKERKSGKTCCDPSMCHEKRLKKAANNEAIMKPAHVQSPPRHRSLSITLCHFAA